MKLVKKRDSMYSAQPPRPKLARGLPGIKESDDEPVPDPDAPTVLWDEAVEHEFFEVGDSLISLANKALKSSVKKKSISNIFQLILFIQGSSVFVTSVSSLSPEQARLFNLFMGLLLVTITAVSNLFGFLAASQKEHNAYLQLYRMSREIRFELLKDRKRRREPVEFISSIENLKETIMRESGLTIVLKSISLSV
jgi:hypothetical protein